MESVVVAWSGGKDAAYALHTLDIEVVELLTTINTEHDRSTMHGVRRGLHRQQAERLGLSLNEVELPPEPDNDAYERRMVREFEQYREQGVDAVVFADIELADVRSYREGLLAEAGIRGHWPLWGRDTDDLVAAVLDAGFRATVVAVDGDALGATVAGRDLDSGLLADLPPSVDPCGENGEFHTFVHDGPPFASPVPVTVTGQLTRSVGDTTVHYADLAFDGAADGKQPS